MKDSKKRTRLTNNAYDAPVAIELLSIRGWSKAPDKCLRQLRRRPDGSQASSLITHISVRQGVGGPRHLELSPPLDHGGIILRSTADSKSRSFLTAATADAPFVTCEQRGGTRARQLERQVSCNDFLDWSPELEGTGEVRYARRYIADESRDNKQRIRSGYQRNSDVRRGEERPGPQRLGASRATRTDAKARGPRKTNEIATARRVGTRRQG